MEKNITMICPKCSAALKDLWQKENKNIAIQAGDHLKVRITGKNAEGKEQHEHMWFIVNGILGQDIFDCTLANEPQYVADVKYKDEFVVKFESIEDRIPLGMSMEQYDSERTLLVERFKKLNPHENHEE